MKPRKAAQGIISRNPDHSDWDSFHIECDCTDPDHALDVHLSVTREEADDDYVCVELYSKLSTPWQLRYSKKHGGWGFFTRLKLAAKLLFKGWLEVEHSIILKDQAALNVGQALVDSVKKHQERIDVKKLGSKS
jgi:hypothetical protein